MACISNSWNNQSNSSDCHPHHSMHDSSSSSRRSCSDDDIDAYAQKVLESHSSQEPDSSLGSYITSVIRNSEEDDVKDLSDFDSLLELVQEHCVCSELDALEALTDIATVVRTKEIPVSAQILGGSVAELSYPSSQQHGFAMVAPLQADNLIPIDLMGVLEDPSTPKGHEKSPVSVPETDPSTSVDEAFPPLGVVAVSAASSKKKSSKRNSAHHGDGKPKPADDIAAALFAQPRSRQSSIDETSPIVRPLSNGEMAPPNYYLEDSLYLSTIEMLLSMNADVSEEAASVATSLAQCDVNVGQYLIDSATKAPPVCRHLLQNGCYRSDCQFSHDVNGHTCSFWLRGRCGKGENCRFLHGFNPQLLEGLHQYSAMGSEGKQEKHQREFPELTKQSLLSGPETGQGSDARVGGMSGSLVWSEKGGGRSSSNGSNSFANIASQGPATFEDHSDVVRSQRPLGSKPPKVDIPQEVWSAHENRDSSAFFIADPLERYQVVAAQSARMRDDVLDLHFQSTKTFAVVLERVLPMKLSGHSQGVWIVCGTGHHVGSKTHQKGGGALESAVVTWLEENGYDFAMGRDRNGLSGALLVYN